MKGVFLSCKSGSYQAVGPCGVVILVDADGNLVYSNLNLEDAAGKAYAQKLAGALEAEYGISVKGVA